VDPRPGDEALITDIDLAILGAPESRFDEYEAQIRREYSWVPEPLFRNTRARLLSGWLDRPAIYVTEHFRERLEVPARRNLRRSLSRLNDSTT
jgi:predicted metal-dependent HD superfamily phosphohydrolase